MQNGAAPAATKVWVYLNDRGRLALADRLGSAVDRVEGTVTVADDSVYVLSVSRVFLLSGYSNGWTGESVRVPVAYTSGFQIRKLDKFRTSLVAGGALVAVVVFVITRNLIGSGSSSADGGSQLPTQTH